MGSMAFDGGELQTDYHFLSLDSMRVILLYHINYGVRQGFLILRKAVTTQGKNNVIF